MSPAGAIFISKTRNGGILNEKSGRKKNPEEGRA